MSKPLRLYLENRKYCFYNLMHSIKIMAVNNKKYKWNFAYCTTENYERVLLVIKAFRYCEPYTGLQPISSSGNTKEVKAYRCGKQVETYVSYLCPRISVHSNRHSQRTNSIQGWPVTPFTTFHGQWYNLGIIKMTRLSAGSLLAINNFKGGGIFENELYRGED